MSDRDEIEEEPKNGCRNTMPKHNLPHNLVGKNPRVSGEIHNTPAATCVILVEKGKSAVTRALFPP